VQKLKNAALDSLCFNVCFVCVRTTAFPRRLYSVLTVLIRVSKCRTNVLYNETDYYTLTRFHYIASHNSSGSTTRCRVQFINVVELVASVDVDPAPVLANWTTRRKYVIMRPRICHAKQSPFYRPIFYHLF